jgi:hypothetical protein
MSECIVLRSAKRLGAYVYVRDLEALKRMPPALASALGELSETLRFELTPTRKLAQADAAVVIANLDALGYHVQFPPPPPP